MIGYREWQPGDDHIRERFTRNIDTAPKTVRSEKDAARCSFKLLEQFPTRHAPTLHEKIHSFLRKKLLHLRRHLLHVAVARKKNESAAVGFFDKMRDPTF